MRIRRQVGEDGKTGRRGTEGVRSQIPIRPRFLSPCLLVSSSPQPKRAFVESCVLSFVALSPSGVHSSIPFPHDSTCAARMHVSARATQPETTHLNSVFVSSFSVFHSLAILFPFHVCFSFFLVLLVCVLVRWTIRVGDCNLFVSMRCVAFRASASFLSHPLTYFLSADPRPSDSSNFVSRIVRTSCTGTLPAAN